MFALTKFRRISIVFRFRQEMNVLYNLDELVHHKSLAHTSALLYLRTVTEQIIRQNLIFLFPFAELLSDRCSTNGKKSVPIGCKETFLWWTEPTYRLKEHLNNTKTALRCRELKAILVLSVHKWTGELCCSFCGILHVCRYVYYGIWQTENQCKW